MSCKLTVAQVADPQLQSVSMSSSACDLLCFFTLWTTLDPAGVTVLRLTGPSSMQAKAEYAHRQNCSMHH